MIQHYLSYCFGTCIMELLFIFVLVFYFSSYVANFIFRSRVICISSVLCCLPLTLFIDAGKPFNDVVDLNCYYRQEYPWRTSFFRDVAQCNLAVGYRRIGTAYRPLLQGSSSLLGLPDLSRCDQVQSTIYAV